MDRQRAGLPGPSDAVARLAREWTEQSCAAQGLPAKVTDRAVVAQVAALLGATSTVARHRVAPDGEAAEERQAA